MTYIPRDYPIGGASPPPGGQAPERSDDEVLTIRELATDIATFGHWIFPASLRRVDYESVAEGMADAGWRRMSPPAAGQSPDAQEREHSRSEMRLEARRCADELESARKRLQSTAGLYRQQLAEVDQALWRYMEALASRAPEREEDGNDQPR